MTLKRKILRLLVGNFCGISQGKLKLLLCLNIKEKCNEQCVGEGPTTIHGSTWSLQRHVTSKFLTYTCSSSSPESISMGHLSPPVGPYPSPGLLPKGSRWAWASECSHSRMATRQCWGCFCSHHQGKLHSLASSPCLAFLLPASLTLSCSWAFLPSMPDHSSVTNYHCWAVTIRTCPSLLMDISSPMNE